jgi:hypothetical protein
MIFLWSENVDFASRIRVLFLMTVLWLLSPQRDLKAEDSITYKFQSWQEDDGRIRVDAHYAQLETVLSTETKLKIVGLVDTISGATPSGQPAPAGSDQVPLSQLTDRREAGQIEVAHPFEGATLVGSFARSKESDYISDVWSAKALIDFNQKNTTLQLGYARANDDITAVFLPEPRKKTADDFIIGVTQLLSPQTVITANLSYGYTSGYISDPYKIVEKRTEVLPGFFLDLTFPENRPSSKDKWVGFVSVNHALENLNAAVEGSYRLLDDTFGTTSHTVELAWFQKFGERLIIRPAVRFYQQSATDFYRVDLNGTSITAPGEATGRAPYYSADYRLSEMRTWMLGIKAVWEINEWCAIDATFERYLMEGRDRVTPVSAYADANVFTIGFKLWR